MTKSRSQNTKAVIRVVGTFGSLPDTEKSEQGLAVDSSRRRWCKETARYEMLGKQIDKI
jgi:hypothetical protein